jgi:molybdopterin/thiamine biosynthesis adenylyltransferase
MDREQFLRDAFSRNLGLLAESEQQRLAEARVAIAGAGGVGGLHVLTLARLGVGKFRIADFDTFDAVNINRQFGAMASTFGKHKAEVIAAMARDINPYAEVDVFPEGVTLENLDAFLDGVRVYVDGIDFFEIEIRRAVFKRCREKGIYALTAAPLGFGATLQVFAPNGMSFDDYFGITDALSYMEKIAAFAAGLAPRPFHIKYLDLSHVSMARKTGPAVAPACTLASSLIATETVKIITGKGVVRPVPHYLQFDMLRNKFKNGYLLWGGKNPLQVLMRKMILKKALADNS